MKEVILHAPFNSEEEYFLFEEKSQLKHEYINSTLFELSGAFKFHNKLERRLCNLIEAMLNNPLYEVYSEGFKVRTSDGNFFYPDIILTETVTQKYYTDKPILLGEILSDSTRSFDLADKFVQYKKFPGLAYYLCVEPEETRVVLYSRDDNNEWTVDFFTREEDVIPLSKLGITLPLKDIYQM